MDSTRAQKLAKTIQSELDKLKPILIIDPGYFKFADSFDIALKPLRPGSEKNLMIADRLDVKLLFPRETISVAGIGSPQVITELNDLLTMLTVKLSINLDALAPALQEFLAGDAKAQHLNSYELAMIVTVRRGSLSQIIEREADRKLGELLPNDVLDRIKAAIKWN